MTDYSAPSHIPAGEDPGRTLGIVGLILAFFFNIVGLIVSIIALNKSRKAGHKNGPAVAGIIVGIVMLILFLIAAVLIATLAQAGFEAINDMCTGFDAGTYEVQGGGTIECP
ncbi:MAG: hypothetical protein JWP30_1515 [Homoserinimonas sp.]|jgi:Ca2+/H+ antiporter|nr:hypothetical protein [Homoserinimonas sp.]